MDSLVPRLVAFARARALFPEPGMALVAVSGGPDSVAALDLLHDAREALSLTLAVGHVDHGIAGESAAVAQQVRDLAARYDLPFRLTTLALGAATSETRARPERYAALRTMQRELGARYLVTAHQADDQVETVLYRLLRGSGPAGLAGIPASGPDGLVRPFLSFTRAELKAWLDARMAAGAERFAIHTDPANFDPRHDRSWLRHNVLPVLRSRLGPDVDRRLARQATQAAQERRAWQAALRALPALDYTVSDGVGEVARAPLLAYDKALSLALLRAMARAAGCTLGERRARRVLRFARDGQSGHAIELGGGWMAELVFDRVRVHRAQVSSAVPRELIWGADPSGELRFGAWTLRWCPDKAGTPARTAWTTWVTPGLGAVRTWCRGDRVQPLGGAGHRAVSRVLMEARVARRERGGYPLVVRDAAVLWVPGVCRSATDVPPPGTAAVRLEAEPSSL